MKKSIVISLIAFTIIVCTTIYTFASTGIVTTDTLRVRKEASTDSSIIALISINDKIEILGEKDGWYKISATVSGKKVQGYVSQKYVKVEKTEKPAKNETSKPKNEEKPEVKEEVPAETTVNKEETNTKENEAENVEKQEEQPQEQEQKEDNTQEEQEQQEKTMVKILPAQTSIYITPLINSLVLNTLEEERIIEITSEVNGWAYVTTGDIQGWVRTENIEEKEESKAEEQNSSQKTGYISGNSVSLREEAKTSANVILKLLKNSKVTVLSEENGWTKVKYNDEEGYVISKYVSDKKVSTTSRSAGTRKNKENETKKTSEASTTKSEDKPVAKTKKGNVTGSEIVDFAKKYLGSKYVYGGSSPKGFDCSGFTTYVYKNFGYTLSRTSSGQSSQGKSVSKSELKLGDLVFFSKKSGSKKIGHVGIYVGGGKFIHAANSRKGVIISNLSGSGFYYVSARRII